MERAHRELPDGERRVQRSIVNTSRSFAPNGFPVIKECRNVPSRLQRSGIRYHAGVIILKSIRRYLFLDSIVCVDNRLEEFFSMVTYRGRKCELSVNLGGNAGPGSRPKGA